MTKAELWGHLLKASSQYHTKSNGLFQKKSKQVTGGDSVHGIFRIFKKKHMETLDGNQKTSGISPAQLFQLEMTLF